ncbi:MAG: Jag N-terminal domain-containing protein [Chloroflexi bacterium]|nr:Jag N-terminal domain-containing protein [Chloroflexota bacterium]
MQGIEATGRTVEEAVAKALKQLGLSSDQVDVEVIPAAGKPLPSLVRKLKLPFSEIHVRVIPRTEAVPAEGQPVRAVSVQWIEIAIQIVERLLAGMGIQATITRYDALMETPRYGYEPVVLNLTTTESARLIGHQGQTLTALEYITRLILSQHLQQWAGWLLLDVDGYQARQGRALRQLAAYMADRVRLSGEPITLEPMPAPERKVIHQCLQFDPDVTTVSTGEEPQRCVTIISRHSLPSPSD